MSANTAIRFICSSCGYRARIPAKFEGKHIKCPSCKSTELVSADDGPATGSTVAIKRLDGGAEKVEGKFRFVCSECSYRARIPMKYAGMAIKCPGCGAAQMAKAEEGESESGDTVQISKVDISAAKGADKFRFQCEGCGYRAKLPKRFENQNIKCPGCGSAQVATPLDEHEPITGDTMILQIVEEADPPEAEAAAPAFDKAPTEKLADDQEPAPVMGPQVRTDESGRLHFDPFDRSPIDGAEVDGEAQDLLAELRGRGPKTPLPEPVASAPVAPAPVVPAPAPVASAPPPVAATPPPPPPPTPMADPAEDADDDGYERTPTGISILPGATDEDDTVEPAILPGSGTFPAAKPAAGGPSAPEPIAPPPARARRGVSGVVPAPGDGETRAPERDTVKETEDQSGYAIHPSAPTRQMDAFQPEAAGGNRTTRKMDSFKTGKKADRKPVVYAEPGAGPSRAPAKSGGGKGLLIVLVLLLLVAVGGGGWLYLQWQEQQTLAGNLQTELDSTKGDLATAQQDLRTERTAHAATSAERDATATELSTKISELETLQGQVTSLTAAKGQLEEQVQGLRDQASELESKVTQATADLKAKVTELTTLSTEKEALETRIEELKNQLHEATKALNAVQKGGLSFKVQADQATAKAKAAEAEAASAKQERDALRQELDTLRKGIDDIPEKIREKYFP